jgi:hypothetical protein
MKKNIILFITIFFSISSNSQVKVDYNNYFNAMTPKFKRAVKSISEVNCNSNTTFNCNQIDNNTFTPNDPDALNPFLQISSYPFNVNTVPLWGPSSGTPNLYDVNSFYSFPATFRQPPFPNAGLAYFAVASIPGYANVVEGVSQRIPNLTAGNNYVMSFFKAYSQRTDAGTGPFYTPRMRFRIVLSYCANYVDPSNNGSNVNYQEVSFAGQQHQIIYQEIDMSNPNWQQVFIKFIPNNNYNLITITPGLTNFASTAPGQQFIRYGGGTVFSFPELLNVNNFTAGTATAPSTNCNVTIGPITPNCTVQNAQLSWYGPNGQVIMAPANQQIQVDASNPNNVGTWTLQMSVPGAVATNNTVSTNNPILQSSVNVGLCNASWPKVYLGRYPSSLSKSINGNIYMNWTAYENSPNFGGLIAGQPNLNHNGVPIQPSIYLDCCRNQMTNYTQNGFTNWSLSNWPLLSSSFSTSSNIISAGGNSFYNNINGSATSLITTLLPNEIIVAELSNGYYLTVAGGTAPITYGGYLNDYSFYTNTYRIRNTSGIEMHNIVISAHDCKMKLKYSSNKLYISTNSYVGYDASGTTNSSFKIYDLSTNTFNLINSFSNTNFELMQVSDDNKVFGLTNNNGFIVEFNNNVLSPIILPYSGRITLVENDNPYSENRHLFRVGLNSNNYFSYDFLTNTLNPLTTNNCRIERFVYDGPNIYLAGIGFSNTPNTIGNQTFTLTNPILVPFINEVILTKLNINTDFNRMLQTENKLQNIINPSFSITPNPSKSEIFINSINLNPKSKYSIVIGNTITKNQIVIKNYSLNTPINIMKLQKGINFVTLIDDLGNKFSSTLIKQ